MNSKISENGLTKIATKKVYIGHQSVGYNILNGINILANEFGTKLNIVEGLPDTNCVPAFYHSRIGRNYMPFSKIDEFVAKMEGGIASKVEIAFFKFCYVDFSKDTEINKIFEHFKESMRKLKLEFPDTKFIYCTVPLVSSGVKLKLFMKSLLGRPNNDKMDNIQRNKFNQLILAEYDNKEIVFDIARYESNLYQTYFVMDSCKIFTLNTAYTSDGGHLNDMGSKVVAKGLLELLCNLN
jgi:hypothetical protein